MTEISKLGHNYSSSHPVGDTRQYQTWGMAHDPAQEMAEANALCELYTCRALAGHHQGCITNVQRVASPMLSHGKCWIVSALGLLHNLGDGCRGQNRGSATVDSLHCTTRAVAESRELLRDGDAYRVRATSITKARQNSRDNIAVAISCPHRY